MIKANLFVHAELAFNQHTRQPVISKTPGVWGYTTLPTYGAAGSYPEAQAWGNLPGYAVQDYLTASLCAVYGSLVKYVKLWRPRMLASVPLPFELFSTDYEALFRLRAKTKAKKSDSTGVQLITPKLLDFIENQKLVLSLNYVDSVSAVLPSYAPLIETCKALASKTKEDHGPLFEDDVQPSSSHQK